MMAGRGFWIGFGAALVILAAIVFWVAWPFIFPPSFVPAKLVEVQGEVFVDGKPAKEGMQLSEGAKITTKAGSAALLYWDSSVTRLDRATEVVLENINIPLETRSMSVKQLSGRTWHKLFKLTGLKSHKLSSASVVATVRGTAYSFDLENDEALIMVGEGEVEIKAGGETDLLTASTAAKASAAGIERVAYSEDEWIAQNERMDMERAEEVKERILKRYGAAIILIKGMYGLTDADLDMWFAKYVAGEVEVDIVEEELPQLVNEFMRGRLKPEELRSRVSMNE